VKNVFFVCFGGIFFEFFFLKKNMFLDTCKGFLWKKGLNFPDFEILKRKSHSIPKVGLNR
jgi:hypothetical protein